MPSDLHWSPSTATCVKKNVYFYFGQCWFCLIFQTLYYVISPVATVAWKTCQTDHQLYYVLVQSLPWHEEHAKHKPSIILCYQLSLIMAWRTWQIQTINYTVSLAQSLIMAWRRTCQSQTINYIILLAVCYHGMKNMPITNYQLYCVTRSPLWHEDENAKHRLSTILCY